MTIVTASEAQTMLAQLLARVAGGEEVLITDGGLPVARLIQPNPPKLIPPASRTQARPPEADRDEDDDRPWRGVFAIESPGDPYRRGMLHLPPEPLMPEPQPADILWDRMDSTDD